MGDLNNAIDIYKRVGPLQTLHHRESEHRFHDDTKVRFKTVATRKRLGT